jgi:hypothetical protein
MIMSQSDEKGATQFPKRRNENRGRWKEEADRQAGSLPRLRQTRDASLFNRRPL